MASVLLVSPLFPPNTGGVQNLMEQIAIRTRHDIHVLTRPRNDGREDEYSFDVTRLKLWSATGSANFLRFLMKNGSEFDIIYFSRPTRKPFELIGSLFAPVLSHAHGSELQFQHLQLDPKFSMHRLRTLWRRLFFRTGLRYIDGFIPVSGWTRDRLLEHGVSESAVRVIHPGVDFDRFASGDCGNLTWSPDPDCLTLLTVARLDPRKGHRYVIRAIENVDDVEYVVAGDGDERGTLEKLVSERGLDDRVTFLGYVDDEALPSLYDCCDVFVMPGSPDSSSAEGFGIAYLEANAAGKPAIGSGMEGMSAAINHGETGRLVSPDASELEDTIREFRENGGPDTKKACKEWARRHDWERIVSRIDDEIDRVLRS